MPLCVGWHRAIQIFCADYPGKTRETTRSEFDPGGGAWGISPLNGDLGSTQILTQYCGTQSRTVTQVMSSGTTPSSKSPQLSPSGLLRNPRMGSVQMPHHKLTIQTEPQDYINGH
jgi:hypothetical protein